MEDRACAPARTNVIARYISTAASVAAASIVPHAAELDVVYVSLRERIRGVFAGTIRYAHATATGLHQRPGQKTVAAVVCR